MRTSVVFFPFDLFGSPGAGAGVALLADEVREILADNRRETVPTRARAYAGRLRLREVAFDTADSYAGWRRQGRREARSALRRGDFLTWVTGNHLGALPVYDELSPAADRTLVIQLDAHLDVHHFRDCAPEPSHGNFLLHGEGPLPAIINLGHRDLLLPPDHVARYYHKTFPAADLFRDPTPAFDAVRRAARSADRVFLDVDCDVFDRAFFPAVSEPVPFGLGPELFLRLLDGVWSPRVAGLLLSEFNPARDQDDRGLSLLVWLLEYVWLKVYESPAAPGGFE
jgi:agmatinase